MKLEKLTKILIKHMDIISYGFFGVCSTLLNIIAYYVLAHHLHMDTIPSTILAWVIAVLFAYVVNRIFVFQSQVRDIQGILREFYLFVGWRLGTELLDIAAMFIFVDVMHHNDMITKAVANIIVIIVNYIASKFFVFKR